MSKALKVSSDIFFFKLGARAFDQSSSAIQPGRASSGSGARPGSTCRASARPGAGRGVAQQGLSGVRASASRRTRSTAGTMAALYKCGGIERQWNGGDDVNLAVGQGDLQATPLQLAVAYAALANNGTIVGPHLAKAIQDGNGVTLQEFRPKPSARSSSTSVIARSCSTACAAPPGGGGHLGRRLQGLADEGIPGLWEDRHGRALPEPRPGVVRLLREATATARSSSSRPSRRAASAPRPPRRPRA